MLMFLHSEAWRFKNIWVSCNDARGRAWVVRHFILAPPQIPIRRLVSVFFFSFAANSSSLEAEVSSSYLEKHARKKLERAAYVPFLLLRFPAFLQFFSSLLVCRSHAVGEGFQGTSCICVCAVEIPGTGGDTSQFSDPTVGSGGQQRQRHCASSFPTSARVQTPLIGNWKTKFQEKKGMNRNEAFRMPHPATVAAASERTTARTHTHTKRGGSKVGKNGIHHTIY